MEDEGRKNEAARLRERLGSVGSHMTRQREAVYSCLRRSGHHPTAEELYLGVKRELPRISLGTVYKNLEALVNCGLATKVTAGDGAARYEVRTDHHYHSRCLTCGAMVDLEPEAELVLPGLVPVAPGFKVAQYRVEVIGYCKECTKC
ncbi:MAG: transcriptional repressor [Acidobacteria bacterium]|nr:transcriptional repressor [Acidobacteriota bacterium]